jgi:hypothetical protein
MRTLALVGGLLVVVLASGCGGAKGLPKGPSPEYEEDPAPDAGSPAADAGATDAATPPASP